MLITPEEEIHKFITLMCTMYNCGIGSCGSDGFKSKILVANLPSSQQPSITIVVA
jgi:hypothetical protein